MSDSQVWGFDSLPGYLFSMITFYYRNAIWNQYGTDWNVATFGEILNVSSDVRSLIFARIDPNRHMEMAEMMPYLYQYVVTGKQVRYGGF